jgi:hypothetical protein
MAIGDNSPELEESSSVSEPTLQNEEDLSSEEEELDLISLENIEWEDKGKHNIYAPFDNKVGKLNETFSHEAFPFTGAAPGPTAPVSTVIEIIEMLIPDEVIAICVEQSNIFSTTRGTKRSRQKNQKAQLPISTEEFWIFIALMMLAEIHDNVAGVVFIVQ